MNVLFELIAYFFSGFYAGIVSFFSALNLYNILDGIKETLIAAFFNVPVFVVSSIVLLITITRIVIKIRNAI